MINQIKTPNELLMEHAGMVPASAGMAYTPEQMLMQESGMLPHLSQGGSIDNLSPGEMEAALIYNNHTPPKFQYATGGPVHMAEGKQVDKTG